MAWLAADMPAASPPMIASRSAMSGGSYPLPPLCRTSGLPAQHGVEPMLARGDRGLVEIAVVVGKDEPDLAIVALLVLLLHLVDLVQVDGWCVHGRHAHSHSPLR